MKMPPKYKMPKLAKTTIPKFSVKNLLFISCKLIAYKYYVIVMNGKMFF